MATHSSVLDLYLKMGYTKTEGVCHGVSLRWIEACILGEQKQFQERIKRIETLAESNQDILKALNETKAKKGTDLNEQDRELLDIHTFFDSIELYQSPDEHSDVFNTPHRGSQHNLKFVSSLASSDKIHTMGGLTEIYSEPLIKTTQEIKLYLNKLRLAIKGIGYQSTETLGLVLNNFDHTLALTYKVDTGWGFMDINQYPATFHQLKDTNAVAELIAKGFPGNPVAFNTAIVTTKNNPQLSQLTTQLNQFKNSHVINKKIAVRENKGVGLAFIAARHNHVHIITKLAKNKANLNLAAPEGKTPAFIAAENGHVSIIIELAKHKADLNIASLHGETPAYMAAQNGHVHVIVELAKNKADLNKTNNDGITPAFIAAQFGHASVIAVLGKENADLNKANNKGWSPIHAAAEFGHAHVIKKLANYKANLNIAHKENGMTAAYMAAAKGHVSVLVQLIKYGADLTLAYTSSAENLREFASKHTPEVITRMEQFLNQQLAVGAQTISISPYDIAKILGHEKVIQLLDTHNLGNAHQHASINRNSFFNKAEVMLQKNSSHDIEIKESANSWSIIETIRSLCPR